MRTLTALTVLMTASVALAGPDWTEVPDAPKIPPGQGIPFSPVNSIMGELTGIDAAGGPDTADLYAITTTAPGTVVKTGGGGPLREADFDTILVVFRTDGTGVVANDDVAPGDTSSAVTIPSPGTYLVAVAAKGVQPVSAGGIMFNIYQPGKQYLQVGPTNAGMQPVLDFVGTPLDPEPRHYIMRLSKGIPAMSGPALAALGAAFVVGSILILRRMTPGT